VPSRHREERLQVMLSHDELATLDEFRFQYRLPSRAAAIGELLRRGLAAPETGAAMSSSHSKDFGVLGQSNGSGFEEGEQG
jgi:hypothetical protein